MTKEEKFRELAKKQLKGEGGVKETKIINGIASALGVAATAGVLAKNAKKHGKGIVDEAKDTVTDGFERVTSGSFFEEIGKVLEEVTKKDDK